MPNHAEDPGNSRVSTDTDHGDPVADASIDDEGSRTAQDRGDSTTRAGRSDESPAAREDGRPVMVYLHFDATQLDTCTGLGELGTTNQLVTIEQIRAWCGTAGSITIRPVIDLNKSRSTRSYQPTEIMREHLALRDRTCVFPHCTRTAHPVRRRGTGEYSHDADHIVPHESGGETSTDNLACLCRLHHLLKTHTDWRYEMLGPGEYLWKSPGGHQFLRTDNGTTMLTMPRGRERPAAA